VASNPGRNLQAIFDPGLQQKIGQKFPARLTFNDYLLKAYCKNKKKLLSIQPT